MNLLIKKLWWHNLRWGNDILLNKDLSDVTKEAAYRILDWGQSYKLFSKQIPVIKRWLIEPDD